MFSSTIDVCDRQAGNRRAHANVRSGEPRAGREGFKKQGPARHMIVEFILLDVPRILTGDFPNVTILNWGFPKQLKRHLQQCTAVRTVCNRLKPCGQFGHLQQCTAVRTNCKLLPLATLYCQADNLNHTNLYFIRN